MYLPFLKIRSPFSPIKRSTTISCYYRFMAHLLMALNRVGSYHFRSNQVGLRRSITSRLCPTPFRSRCVELLPGTDACGNGKSTLIRKQMTQRRTSIAPPSPHDPVCVYRPYHTCDSATIRHFNCDNMGCLCARFSNYETMSCWEACSIGLAS